MTAMEHCDDTVKEHCDEKDFWSILMKGHGPLWLKVTRNIVMIWAENSVMTVVMEYCEKK